VTDRTTPMLDSLSQRILDEFNKLSQELAATREKVAKQEALITNLHKECVTHENEIQKLKWETNQPRDEKPLNISQSTNDFMVALDEALGIIVQNVEPDAYKKKLKHQLLKNSLLPTHGTCTGETHQITWTYEGEMLNGKAHGHGKQKFSDGEVRVGTWIHDQMDGHFITMFKDGDKIVSNFLQNEIYGHRKLTYSNGNYGVDEFSHGLKHGYEFQVSKDEKAVWMDKWEMGSKVDSKKFQFSE